MAIVEHVLAIIGGWFLAGLIASLLWMLFARNLPPL